MNNATPYRPSCANCAYFRVGPKDITDMGMGNCVRFPPATEHFITGKNDDGSPQFTRMIQSAITPATGWCGEHRRTQGELPPKVSERRHD